MKSLAKWCMGERAAPPAHNDYWYQPVGTATQAGIRISPETALMISAVYRCVTLISGLVASLPLIMYQRLSDGGKERAYSHPLYEILHDQPNDRQTAFEFREYMTGCLALRGNAYAEIKSGPRGFASQLIPMDPTRVLAKRVSTGQVVYDYNDPISGRARRMPSEDVFHLMLYSEDGLTGLSPIALHREGIGLSMAAEIYGARFFGAGSAPSGILHAEGKLTTEQRKANKASWNNAHRGVLNSHEIAVMEGGLKWQQMGLSNEDSQFLETRQFQVSEIAGRIYGVPLHLVGEHSKSTSWGTGIEQQNLGLIQYTLEPYLSRWEQLIRKDLILAKRLYFAEFLRAALLRGDLKSRYAAYQIAINANKPWLSVNDVRRAENLNPIDGGDDYSPSVNVQPAPASNSTNGGTEEEE